MNSTDFPSLYRMLIEARVPQYANGGMVPRFAEGGLADWYQTLYGPTAVTPTNAVDPFQAQMYGAGGELQNYSPAIYVADGVSPPGPSGTGVGSVGPTSDGLAADANAQSVVSVDNASSPAAQTANQAMATVMGLLAPTPVGLTITAMRQLAKMIAQSGQSNPVGMPSPQEVKSMDPLGNPAAGVGQGVGNTNATSTDNGTNTANPGVSNPGEVASVPGPAGTTAEGGGVGGGAPSGQDASGNNFGRGGLASVKRRPRAKAVRKGALAYVR